MTFSHYRNKLLVFLGLLLAIILAPRSALAQTVSPMMGVGAIQLLDNNAQPLTGGVVYFYQAGTSTQQATYTDSTGLVQNPSPVPLNAGGRANIWLLTTANYKIVECLQNDGPTCAIGDILAQVDNVPGGSSGGGGGDSGTWTGTLVSGSVNPATSGIVRLASGDTICWRNAAGSANLCFSKDSSDLLSWSGGSFKLPEINRLSGIAGFDLLWADNGGHRLWMAGNGGTAQQIVGSGVDINTSDEVTQLHFGSTPIPIGGTAPVTGQVLQYNGTELVGSGGGTICTNSTPVTVANTTSTTNLQSCTIPVNTLSSGSIVQIDETGVIGTATGGNYALNINTTIGSGTCTIVTNTAPGNNQPWNLVVKLTVLTSGTPGTANMSCEYFSSPTGGGVVGPNGIVGSPTFSLITTTSETLQVTVSMSVANATNEVIEQLLKGVMFQ